MLLEVFEITRPHNNNINWLVVYLLLYYYEKSDEIISELRYWSLIKSWPSYYLQGIDIYNVCFIEILKPLSHVIKSCERGFCVINMWFIGLRICNNFPFLLVQMITDDLWHDVSYVCLQIMQSLYIFFATKTEKRELDLFLCNMIQVCSHLVLSINVKSRRQMVLSGNYYKTIVW